MSEFQGYVTNITYRNAGNGFTVLVVESGKKTHSVVGILPLVEVGMEVLFEGEFVDNPQYGEQFKAGSFKEVQATDARGMK
nr:ATP-dependent RecD-like DNA helicase [Lachnospiraceae bacterium]